MMVVMMMMMMMTMTVMMIVDELWRFSFIRSFLDVDEDCSWVIRFLTPSKAGPVHFICRILHYLSRRWRH